jgi:hypothetical protein
LYLQREERLFSRPLRRPTDEDIRAYLAVQNAQLGWLPQWGVDPDGSRHTTTIPYGAKTCVSLYGDSFTWGADVSAADAPHNQLAGMLGCRVASYAFGGYGIDQAVLRHALNAEDTAPVVMLVLYPQDILRSLTQNYGFVARNRDYLFLKPKFVIDENDELKLEPIPFTTFEQVRAYVDDAENVLKDDPFRPNGELGSIEAHFPYSIALLRVVFHARFWRLLQSALGSETEASYYFNTDPAASRLAVRLIEYFVANAAGRGQTPIVAILPTKSDVEYQLKYARCQYAPFAARLEARGIRLHCLGDFFVRHLGGRSFCELVDPRDCSLHYTPEGYRVMAEGLAALVNAAEHRAR